MDHAAQRCVECSYDLEGLTGTLCPECATPIDAKPFKGLRVYFVLAAIANGLFILCPCYGLFLTVVYWLSEDYVDDSMVIMIVLVVATLGGLVVSISAAKDARELAWRWKRRGRVAIICLTLLPVWALASIALASFVITLVSSSS